MLREAIQRVLFEYGSAIQKDFGDHPLTTFIRSEFPQLLSNLLDNPERYKVFGSAGQGNWARCPWVAIFDTLVTVTAQSGYYPVYLFREDLSGVYLSLNQGVTEVREKYRSKAKEALRSRAKDFLSQIGKQKSFPLSEIDLNPSSPSNLSAFYEAGNICAYFYRTDTIPSDEILESNFREMLTLYDMLSYTEPVPASTSEREEDEEASLLIEDLRRIRKHKRIDRNSRLAREAKRIHGTSCKVCSFSFEEHYGELGKGFIEAHHLQPLSKLKGEKLLLNPKDDFTVLCSNCHRMIHRYDRPEDISGFINTIEREIDEARKIKSRIPFMEEESRFVLV